MTAPQEPGGVIDRGIEDWAWMELFKAALSGVVANNRSRNGAAKLAGDIADDALEKWKRRKQSGADE